VSVVANVAINVDSRNAVSKLKQVQQGAQATSQAVDKLNATTAATSNKFKIAANGIKYFTDAAGRARAENGRFLTTAERAAAGIRNQGNAAQQASGQFNLLKNAFSGLAAAFGAGFALTKVIADVKELDTNLRRLGTVGGNVAALDKGLGALSDQLDGVANKAELAAASYQALSAGFTETGANLRVVEAATKAAVGGMVDVTAATEVTTKVLNAYNMSGDQATKVTDSIAKSIEYGVVQWSDYTSQLGRVASISAVAGVSLDEINAFIAAATKNSATAEIAFTGLSATLSNMLRPTTESAEAAAALGINWNLAGIRGEGFESLMGKLGIAMQKNPVLANKMVGGQEAVRGAFAAAAKGGKDYAMILEGLGGAAGKTDADFQTMKGSLENTLKALDTSFKNLSEALGTAFGPTVVIAVQDITKAVNGFADFMAMVPQPVMNTVGTIVKLVAQILLVQKAIQSVIALKAGVTGMLGATAASATAAGTAAGGAATKVNMLKGAMLGLLKFALVTIAIDIVVSGLGKLAEVQARMNAITKGSTKQFAEQVGGSATSRQEIQNLQKQNREERARRVEEEKSVRFPMLTAQDDIARQAITQLDTRFAQLQTMGERARFATPADRARAGATSAANAMNTPLDATVGGGGGRAAGGGADKAASDAKRALEIQKQQYQAADDRNTALKDTFALLQQTEAVAKRELELDIRLGQIAREFNTLKEEAKSADELAMVSLNENLEKKIAELEAEREINELLIERATLVANLVKASSMPTVYNELETQDAALQAILDKYPAIGSAADAAATLATSGMAAMIDGTKSAQEVFAEFLNTIANALMQTAAKMIAQYIAIGIARMFAGMGGGPGSFAPSGPLAAVGNVNTDVSSFFSLNANGNAFGANGIIPFAKGGIVNSPTVFPFAKGIGLMGEAGPEAILPLKRGADGSLGVMASGGGGDVNVVVNVDAKGSSVEGDEQGANQLGRVISAAVQSELIKQQRPGGILAR
jgi:TP901 family phage tail tape measure protein